MVQNNPEQLPAVDASAPSRQLLLLKVRRSEMVLQEMRERITVFSEAANYLHGNLKIAADAGVKAYEQCARMLADALSEDVGA